MLAGTTIVTLILNKVMKGKEFIFKPAVTVGIALVYTLIELILWGITSKVFVGTALLLVLLYASCKDKNCREADDWLSVMILALALGSMSFDRLGSMVIGAAVVFAPQMLIVMISNNEKLKIGGADIKISTATAFLLGFYPGVIGFMTGLLLSIVCQLISSAVKKSKSTEPFPLLPFLSVGLMIGYLL